MKIEEELNYKWKHPNALKSIRLADFNEVYDIFRLERYWKVIGENENGNPIFEKGNYYVTIDSTWFPLCGEPIKVKRKR